MKTIFDVILIIGFIAVDFLFFHDIFKAGEMITTAQWLTGLLSIVVILQSARNLLSTTHEHTAATA